jgi:hypothetical protein
MTIVDKSSECNLDSLCRCACEALYNIVDGLVPKKSTKEMSLLNPTERPFGFLPIHMNSSMRSMARKLLFIILRSNTPTLS